MSVPEINIAMKQMCLEAEVRMLGLVFAHGAPGLEGAMVRSGHCWCDGLELNDVIHVVCCKCNDRCVPTGGDDGES